MDVFQSKIGFGSMVGTRRRRIEMTTTTNVEGFDGSTTRTWRSIHNYFSRRSKINVHVSSWTTVVLLLSCSLGWLPRSVQAQTDLQRCYQALNGADTNQDDRVDASEYPTYLQLYRPDLFEGALAEERTFEFTELPLGLQSTFFSLACTCREDPSAPEDCCLGDQAHLPTASTTNAAAASRLFQICFFVQDSLEDTSEELQNLIDGEGDDDDDDDDDDSSTPAPTVSPSQDNSTTATPTQLLPWTTLAIVEYTIVVQQGQLRQVDFGPDLTGAIDGLVLRIAREQSRARSLQSQRRQLLLENLQAVLPTSILVLEDKNGFTMEPILSQNNIYLGEGPCPADLGVPSQDLCQRVDHAVFLQVKDNTTLLSSNAQEEEQWFGEAEAFKLALQDAVYNGELEAVLQVSSPDSVVTVISGLSSNLVVENDDGSNDSNNSIANRGAGLSAGATTGIVMSSLAVAGMAFCFLFVGRRGPPPTQTKYPSKDSSDIEEQFHDALAERKSSQGDLVLDDLQPAATDSCSPSSSPEHLRPCSPSSSSSSSSLPTSSPAKYAQAMQESSTPNTNYLTSHQLTSDASTSTRTDRQARSRSSSPASSSPTKSFKSLDAESESGWSSDQGNDSSLGTEDGDMDPSDNDSHGEKLGLNPLNSLRGAMSAVFAAYQDDQHPTNYTDYKDDEDSGSVTSSTSSSPGRIVNLDHLEHAIRIGDWAMVGSSAAALAAATDSGSERGDGADVSMDTVGTSSFTSNVQEEWKQRHPSAAAWQLAADSRKATQLDQLIEQGDWEAVIQAAAKFEAEQQRSNEDSDGEQETASDFASTIDYESTVQNHPSQASSTSGDDEFFDSMYVEGENEEDFIRALSSPPSMEKNRSRSQIMELIRQVVPEEVDHVDEMMEEFAGREDDLIETLKAMEERHESKKDSPSKKGQVLAASS